MTSTAADPGPSTARKIPFLSRPAVHALAAKFPLTRPFVRREGAQIFDLIQGFVKSQTLLALVELDVLGELSQGPQTLGALAHKLRLDPRRAKIVLQAGAGIGLLKRRRGERYSLTRRGEALLGVPGLQEMIRHHTLLYDDLRDPVALLRSDNGGALARFWPYVFDGQFSDEEAARYSRLMTGSQALVAQDTLSMVSFEDSRHVMDVGGGSGSFLGHLGKTYPNLTMTLFDLPGALASAGPVLARAGVAERVTLCPGSFRSDALPVGADTVTLVRVCYDHDDDTVLALMKSIHDALPKGGRLVISEPMSGGRNPDPVTDVYFAMYTMAMGTGRTRSVAELSRLLSQSGFAVQSRPRSRRTYITTTLVAMKRC